jgi:hypothetical protein
MGDWWGVRTDGSAGVGSRLTPVLPFPTYIYAPMSGQVTTVPELEPRGGVVPYVRKSLVILWV